MKNMRELVNLEVQRIIKEKEDEDWKGARSR